MPKRTESALDWQAAALAIPLLAAFPGALRAGAVLRRFAAGHAVFRRDDRPVTVYAVLGGEVRLRRITEAGDEVILQRTTRGIVAEASLDQTRYHCDAVATAATTAACIPGDSFRQALDDDAFRSAWIRQLLQELRRARAQSERLSLRSARQRIVHYLETEGSHGRVELTRPRKQWAAELGLTHEALYRTLAEMRKAGELTVDGAVVSLRKAHQAKAGGIVR